MRSQLLSAVTAVGVVAALGAAVTASNPASAPEDAPIFVAVGSTDNSANPGCNGQNNTTCNGKAPVKAFETIVGDLGGMYPGSSSPLRVSFRNPESFDIKVTTLSVSAVPGSPTCPTTYLQIPSTVTLAPAVVLARKGGTGSTTIPVGLKPTAIDACKNVSFNVTVTATAVMN